MARTRSVTKPKVARVPFGPFVGMQTAISEAAEPRRAMHYAENCFPVDPTRGGELVPRPALRYTGGLSASAIKVFCQFETSDGVSRTVAIANGAIWQLSYTTATSPNYQWTQVVSAAVLTSGGITIDATSPTYALVFANRLVVSDGVNRPWTWTGASGGGVQLLANAPVCYGPLTEYYGKLFGIKANDRRTMVWSEENDPTTGYEAGGYNNAWTLAQNADEPLTSLLGRNDGLYYWRPHSTGVIRGAVASDFRTTGVVDGVSETVGTVFPGGREAVGGDIWFIDGRRRVYVVSGDTLTDVTPIVGTSGSSSVYLASEPFGIGQQVRASQAASATPVDHRIAVCGPNDAMTRPQVWVSMNTLSNNEQAILAFDAATRLPVAWNVFPTAPASGATGRLARIFEPQYKAPTVLMGSASDAPTLLDVSPGVDDTTSLGGGQAVVAKVIGPPIVASDGIEFYLGRIDATALSPFGKQAIITLQLLTSDANTSAELLTIGTSPALGSTSTATTERTAFGPDAIGHWFRPVWTATGGPPASYTAHLTYLGEPTDAL